MSYTVVPIYITIDKCYHTQIAMLKFLEKSFSVHYNSIRFEKLVFTLTCKRYPVSKIIKNKLTLILLESCG
jgi:hypothetical protein